MPAHDGRSFWDWAFIAGFAIASFVLVAAVSGSNDVADGPVGVLYPPWTGGGDALTRAAAAGAHLMRPGRFAFVVLVRPTGAGFAGRAKAGGAWMTFDANGLGGCLGGVLGIGADEAAR